MEVKRKKQNLNFLKCFTFNINGEGINSPAALL